MGGRKSWCFFLLITYAIPLIFFFLHLLLFYYTYFFFDGFRLLFLFSFLFHFLQMAFCVALGDVVYDRMIARLGDVEIIRG
jgi:putative effector of murein hydrolase